MRSLEQFFQELSPLLRDLLLPRLKDMLPGSVIASQKRLRYLRHLAPWRHRNSNKECNHFGVFVAQWLQKPERT